MQCRDQQDSIGCHCKTLRDHVWGVGVAFLCKTKWYHARILTRVAHDDISSESVAHIDIPTWKLIINC